MAAAAYRSATELVDERTGLVHDYTRKTGVESAQVVLASGETVDRSALWNAAEGAEHRKDSRTAREWIVALPAELDAGQRQALALSFAGELAGRYGCAADVCIHQPDREGDHRNHHAHILTTTRRVRLDDSGRPVMGDKTGIELSDTKRRAQGLGPARDEVTAVRGLWASLANTALEQAGRSERVDARSLAAQGIEREATTHLGPTASEMERRGRASDRGDGNRQAQANNARRAVLTAEVVDLAAARRVRRAAELEALFKDDAPAAPRVAPPAVVPSPVVDQGKAVAAAQAVVERWDRSVKALTDARRKRAEKLEVRIYRQVEAIRDQRSGYARAHDAKRPSEPRGLLAVFKQRGYELAMDAWREVAGRIEQWRKAREDSLIRREGVVRRWSNPISSPLPYVAAKRIARQQPDLAAALEPAKKVVMEHRMERMRQQQAEAQRRKLERGGRGRGGGGRGL